MTKPVSDRTHLKGLKACLERMFRFCQRRNIIQPRIKIGFLAVEIGKEIDHATPELVEKYNAKYAEMRKLIRSDLLNADDLHKNGNDAACLIEDAMFLLNQVEDKLACITSNMATLRRMGFDDFDTTIALAVALTGRSDIVREGLTKTGLYVLGNPREDSMKRIIKKYRPIAEKLAELDEILNGYIIQIPADIITCGKTPEEQPKDDFDTIMEHSKNTALKHLTTCDEALKALADPNPAWRERKYEYDTRYYLALTENWRLRLTIQDLPWRFDCDITDGNHLPLLSPHIEMDPDSEPTLDDIKHACIAAAIQSVNYFKTEYEKQLAWIEEQLNNPN